MKFLQSTSQVDALQVHTREEENKVCEGVWVEGRRWMKEGFKEACYYLLKPFSLVFSSVILCFLQDKRNKHVPFV